MPGPTRRAARLTTWLVVPAALWAQCRRPGVWQSTTVMSGSMQPRLMIGDIAVVKPTARTQIRLGQGAAVR